MLTTRPTGTNDFLPGESEKWQYIEQLCRQVCAEYGYKEIRLPIFEHTEVYLRSVGETSDIVEKEMYSFEDKGFRHMTLRPEGTAGTVRAFLENKLYADPQPTKLYYMGPMFRYDKPQAGRYRQFNQFGIEVFGADHASIDAEVITLAVEIFRRLGLTGLSVKINTVGCADCRPKHMEELKNKEGVNTGERKLSYEELESNFYQMAEKLNTVYKERQILINQLNSTNNTVTRLNFLFKVIFVPIEHLRLKYY